MGAVLGFAERISRYLVWIGGTLIILSALLVTLEVVLRKLFNTSLGGADELSGYAFGIATTLGFAYALFQRAHIRVDALYNLFPGWLKTVSDLTGIALLGGFAGVVSLMAWGLVADTLEFNSHSITPMRTPLAYPQIPWLIGWIYFVVCCFLVLLAAFIALVKRDFAEVDRLVGNKTVDEQVEEERVS